MSLLNFLMILSFGVPVFISLISIGMMIARRRVDYNITRRKLLTLLIGYFISVFVSGVTVIFFVYEYNLYIYSSPLSFLSLLLSVVFFYHIIFIVTSSVESESLSVLHYAIPFFLTAIHAVWSLFVPYNVQYDIVANRTLDLDNYKWFCLFYSSKLWVYALYQVIYSILILNRMPSYRLHVNNYSADEEKSSLPWLYVVIILELVIIPVSFITFFVNGSGNIIDEIIIITANTLYMIQLVTLQYNMFMENYILMPEDCNGLSKKNSIQPNIDKKVFEQYITEKKPYLNPNLKITDIIYELSTCRSYMSAFINNTYGMNFSRYINTLRMKEFEKLKKDPNNSKRSDTELMVRAGFSYRGFLRFRNNELKNQWPAV